MILGKFVNVGLNGRNFKHYEKLGYLIPRKIDKRGRLNFTKGTKIKVKIEDLIDGSKIKIKVKCEDCKTIRLVYYDSLKKRENSSFNKSGETLCTRCAAKRMSGEKNSQYKHGSLRFPEYRNNAKKRNIEFKITPEFFKITTEQPCHYCGGFSSDYNIKSRGNGIDRKNSDIGYIDSNCVPCCARCNFFKNNIGYEEFIKHIIRIKNNLGL